MYLLNVARPPLLGRVHVSGAAQSLWYGSQNEPRRKCGRSSSTPPATTGTIQQDLGAEEKMTRPNKLCQVFLTSSYLFSLAARPCPQTPKGAAAQPQQPAAFGLMSLVGIQRSGGFMEANSIGFLLRRTRFIRLSSLCGGQCTQAYRLSCTLH